MSRAGVLWNTTALQQNQGCSSACPWITALIAEYLLTSPTVSRVSVEDCIRRGVEAYSAFVALDGRDKEPYCGRQSGYERSGGQLVAIPVERQTQSSGYYTIEAAVKHMRDRGLLRHRLCVGEEIMGFKLPPGFPQQNVPAPFREAGFGYQMTLRDGIHKFVVRAAALAEGSVACAAFSTSNHTITVAAVCLPGPAVRYYAVESLASRGGAAEIMDTSVDVGLHRYLSAAFGVPVETPTAAETTAYTRMLDEALASGSLNDPRLIYSMTGLHIEPPTGDAQVVVSGALAAAPIAY